MSGFAEKEKSLVEKLSKRLGMTVDKTLFRGMIPPDVANAACVMLGGSLKDNNPGMAHFELQILSRFLKRDDLLAFAERLDAVPFSDDEFHLITHGSEGVFVDSWKGKLVYCLSSNFEVFFKN